MNEPSTARASPVAAHANEAIEAWIVERLAKSLEIDRDEIDVDAPLAHYGLDSLQFVLFVTDLENWLGVKFTENPLHEDSSVRSVAQDLAAGSRSA